MQVGDVIGGHTLLRRLASGGMGELYLAARKMAGGQGFKEAAVIKILPPEFSRDPSLIDLIADDVNLSTCIRHPNVVSVYDFGAQDDTYYLAMEYVRGVTLARLLKALSARQWTMNPELSVYVATEVTAALAHVHALCDAEGRPCGIVHRNVSPENVLLSVRGEVKLTDFGLARGRDRLSQTHPDVLRKRLSYRPPEIARDQGLDARSDVFGAGVLLYEMLTTTVPFSARSVSEWLRKIESADFIPVSVQNNLVKPDFEAVIHRALASRPEDRWPTAASLHAALQEIEQKIAPPGSPTRIGAPELSQLLEQLFPETFDDKALPAEPETSPAPPPDSSGDFETLPSWSEASRPAVPVETSATQPQIPASEDVPAVSAPSVRAVYEDVTQRLDETALTTSEDAVAAVLGDVTQIPNVPTQPQTLERLSLLYRIARAFTASLDAKDLAARIIAEVIHATRAEQGALLLRGPDGSLAIAASKSTSPDGGGEVSRGVVERVAAEGAPYLSIDAQEDTFLSGRESVAELKLRSVLCVPLVSTGSPAGVIYLENRLAAGAFTPSDQEVLVEIGRIAATALENAKVVESAREAGRIDRERELSRELSDRLLPAEVPSFDGFELALHRKLGAGANPTTHFLDFVPLGGKLGVACGECELTGYAGAMRLTAVRATLRGSLFGAGGARERVLAANRALWSESPRGHPLGLCYAELDGAEGTAVLLDAGHSPPMLFRAVEGTLAPSAGFSPPIGLVERIEPAESRVELKPGDILILHSGALAQSKAPSGEVFGQERLQEAIKDARSAVEVVNAIDQALDAFRGALAPDKDLTLLCVRRR